MSLSYIFTLFSVVQSIKELLLTSEQIPTEPVLKPKSIAYYVLPTRTPWQILTLVLDYLLCSSSLTHSGRKSLIYNGFILESYKEAKFDKKLIYINITQIKLYSIVGNVKWITYNIKLFTPNCEWDKKMNEIIVQYFSICVGVIAVLKNTFTLDDMLFLMHWCHTI